MYNSNVSATTSIQILRHLTSIGLTAFALAAYLIIIPAFDLTPLLGLYDEKRILECGLLILLSLQLVFYSCLKNKPHYFQQDIPVSIQRLLSAVIVLGLISATSSSSPERSFLDISLYVLLYCSCLIVAAERQRLEIKFDQVFSLTLSAMGALCLVAFLSALTAAAFEPFPLIHWNLFTNFSHVRFLSQLQSWTLPLIVLPLLLNKSAPIGQRLWLPLVIASGWWFLLFSSGTRGTLLGLIIAAIVVLLAFGRASVPWFKWQGISALAGLIFYCGLFILPSFINSLDTSAIQQGTIGRSLSNPSGRFHLWEVALTMIAEHPWLGVGPMHYACGNTNGIAAHPHNSLLQIAAEWGLPVTAMVIFVWISGTLAWIRQGRKKLARIESHHTNPVLYPALLASLITASAHAIFSGIIIMPLSQVAMILVIGWMLGIYFEQGTNTGNMPDMSIMTRIIWLFLPLIAIAVLLYGITPDLINSDGLLKINQLPTGTTHLMPRFWQQGLICD